MRDDPSWCRPIGAAVCLSLLVCSSVIAADSPGEEVGDQNTQLAPADLSEVVVTGTFLRGTAPTGTNVIGVSSQDIAAIGATDVNQVLAKIPQVTSAFNQVPALSATDQGTSLVRPNLRNLGVAQGGTTTLVLLDGHRLANAGILLTSVDPEVITPNVIERVEIIPDGGSATYGSDAVGGVINLITRKRFDGVQVDARGGFADNYHTVDADVMAGTDWGSGSLYGSYAYDDHNQLLGLNRGFVRQISANTGVCSPGTVAVSRGAVTTNYALPGLTPNTMASCDDTDRNSIYPSAYQHTLFGSLMQRFGDAAELDVRAFYSRKESSVSTDLTGQNGQTATITDANPYYHPIAPDPGQQTALFSYQGVEKNGFDNKLEEMGITPELTIDMGAKWQLRAMVNYGRSDVREDYQYINAGAQSAALAATTTATALNPYNIAATSPSVLGSIVQPAFTQGVQQLINERLIAEGPALSLPGGDVRIAVGGEAIHETLQVILTGNAVGFQDTHRNVYAAFGEVAIPIVGAGNALPGIQSLTVSASGRYDHYSDFGSTTNPKVGFTYDPMPGVTVRGNWGTSFDAPSMADSATATDTRLVLLNIAPFRNPADPASSFNRSEILIAGGNGGLQPQRAHTWSIGADFKPAVAPGLGLHATYYNIVLTQEIAVIPFTTPAAFLPAYAPYVIKDPTLAQSLALGGAVTRIDAGSAFPSIAAVYGAGTPYAIMDLRRQNLGGVRQDGIDFNTDYTHPTGFGFINGSIGGTWTLARTQSPLTGLPFADALSSPGTSKLGLIATVGAKAGGLTGSVSLTHSQGYELHPAIGTQMHVASFDVVDLFLKYDLSGQDMLQKNLSFTLNVSNLFDRDPPFYDQDPGYTNGFTLGRLIQLGAHKKF